MRDNPGATTLRLHFMTSRLTSQGLTSSFMHLRAASDVIEVIGSERFSRGNLGTSGVGLSNAYFVAWSWDGRRAEVVSEPWGFAPVFYHSSKQEFIVSDRISEVLARLRDPEYDMNAIAAFLRLGFFLGDDTPWRNIRAIPRTGRVEWRAGEGVRIVGSAPKPGTCVIDRRQAIARYAELFRSAVAAGVDGPGPVAVPLSGGRDSRHILFELVSQGRSPDFCLTAEHLERANEDARVARIICTEFGIPHRVLRQPRRRVQAERWKADATNYCADEHIWATAVVRGLDLEPGCRVFDGIGGGVLSAGSFLDPTQLASYRRGDLTATASAICSRWSGGNDSVMKYVKPKWREPFGRNVALQRIVAALEEHADVANPLTAFYFWNRTRREIAEYTFSMLSSVAVPVAPYLNKTLVQFLLSLPAEMVLDKRFHDETIHHAFPHWRHIAFERRVAAPRRTFYWRRTSLELAASVALGRPDPLTARRSIAMQGLKAMLTGRQWFLSYPLAWRLYWLHRVSVATADANLGVRGRFRREVA